MLCIVVIDGVLISFSKASSAIFNNGLQPRKMNISINFDQQHDI